MRTCVRAPCVRPVRALSAQQQRRRRQQQQQVVRRLHAVRPLRVALSTPLCSETPGFRMPTHCHYAGARRHSGGPRVSHRDCGQAHTLQGRQLTPPQGALLILPSAAPVAHAPCPSCSCDLLVSSSSAEQLALPSTSSVQPQASFARRCTWTPRTGTRQSTSWTPLAACTSG